MISLKSAHLLLSEALAALPAPPEEPYSVRLTHGSLTLGLYVPHEVDPQTPHSRDEVYVVIRGHGEFVLEDERTTFQTGDVLFVPVGRTHRFENFSSDFATWVVFYGPEGGESP